MGATIMPPFMFMWTTANCQALIPRPTGHILHPGSKADVQLLAGPYREKTTAIHFPINADTGLHQVHYTWAGAAALEALCLMFPTVNFALIDSDCVPTSLFEIAELVNLMTDKASRAEAMQHNTLS